MLNGGPLNSAALNSAAHSAVPGPEPIIPGYAFTWRPIVRVGDDDVTPLLTGEIEVDREEGRLASRPFRSISATDLLSLRTGSVEP